jgi:hypothetical protein
MLRGLGVGCCCGSNCIVHFVRQKLGLIPKGIALAVTEISFEVEKDPNEQIWYFCVPCEKYFKSCRDGTGFDQAPCPDCGDPSNTPWFHKGERGRNHDAGNHALAVVLNVVPSVLILLISSGLGNASLKRLF